jgi:hypothetical protein
MMKKFKNTEEYLKDLRQKWEPTELLNNFSDELKTRAAIMLENTAVRVLSESMENEEDDKLFNSDNAYKILVKMAEMAMEEKNLLPDEDMLSTFYISDEFKRAYNEIKKDLKAELNEYELDFCDKCFQMTNHLNGVCQKCKDE